MRPMIPKYIFILIICFYCQFVPSSSVPHHFLHKHHLQPHTKEGTEYGRAPQRMGPFGALRRTPFDFGPMSLFFMQMAITIFTFFVALYNSPTQFIYEEQEPYFVPQQTKLNLMRDNFFLHQKPEFTNIFENPSPLIKKEENQSGIKIRNPWTENQGFGILNPSFSFTSIFENGISDIFKEASKAVSTFTSNLSPLEGALIDWKDRLVNSASSAVSNVNQNYGSQNLFNQHQGYSYKRLSESIQNFTGMTRSEGNEEVDYVMSDNETGPVFKSLDESGCGGIVIADKGEIGYLSQPSSAQQETRCIWTVRASRKQNLRFQLLTFDTESVVKNRNDSRIILTSFDQSYRDTTTTTMDVHSIEKVYNVKGPLVFVTLISNSRPIIPDFQLSFESEGEDLESLNSKYYMHYHTHLKSGGVVYPDIRGTKYYNPNEVATFVVNPKTGTKNFKSESDILKNEKPEVDWKCKNDNLLFLVPSSDEEYTNIRNCKTPNPKFGHLVNSSAFNSFIAIFTTERDHENTEFKFNWLA